jgi:hypothetical protein
MMAGSSGGEGSLRRGRRLELLVAVPGDRAACQGSRERRIGSLASSAVIPWLAGGRCSSSRCRASTPPSDAPTSPRSARMLRARGGCGGRLRAAPPLGRRGATARFGARGARESRGRTGVPLTGVRRAGPVARVPRHWLLLDPHQREPPPHHPPPFPFLIVSTPCPSPADLGAPFPSIRFIVNPPGGSVQ